MIQWSEDLDEGVFLRGKIYEFKSNHPIEIAEKLRVLKGWDRVHHIRMTYNGYGTIGGWAIPVIFDVHLKPVFVPPTTILGTPVTFVKRT